VVWRPHDYAAHPAGGAKGADSKATITAPSLTTFVMREKRKPLVVQQSGISRFRAGAAEEKSVLSSR
jgi:hypothetical protein